MSDPMTTPVGPAQETPKAPEAAGKGIRDMYRAHVPTQNGSAADFDSVTHDAADHTILVAESAALLVPGWCRQRDYRHGYLQGGAVWPAGLWRSGLVC